MASLLGLVTTRVIPADAPGIGDGSAKATWSFDVHVDSQNTCGAAASAVENTDDLSIDDCTKLRDSHAPSASTGKYTYKWDTPGKVPDDTYIYGPYYGDCMIRWFPYDYTQNFTIGTQDVYDIVNAAIGRRKQFWATMPCEGGSGPIIIQWEVASVKANSGASPGPGPFGNIG